MQQVCILIGQVSIYCVTAFEVLDIETRRSNLDLSSAKSGERQKAAVFMIG